MLTDWMPEAGMSMKRDQIENLSLDSQLGAMRDTGKYDELGMLAALACAQQRYNRGKRPLYIVVIIAFADEEDFRFGTTFWGGSVYVSVLDGFHLSLRDRNGIFLSKDVKSFGGNSDTLGESSRGNGDLLGYCEDYIGQSPLCDKLNLQVGMVTAVTGRSCLGISFTGRVGNGGTVSSEKPQVISVENGVEICSKVVDRRFSRKRGVPSLLSQEKTGGYTDAKSTP